jgi:hypothetical protein
MIIMNPLQNLSQIPPPITLETVDAEDTTPESTAVDLSETDAEEENVDEPKKDLISTISAHKVEQ